MTYPQLVDFLQLSEPNGPGVMLWVGRGSCESELAVAFKVAQVLARGGHTVPHIKVGVTLTQSHVRYTRFLSGVGIVML